MKCPNCHEEIETGAAFCGNCGQPLPSSRRAAAPPAPPPFSLVAAGTPAGVPGYALADPGRHVDEIKAVLSLIFGIAGLAGAMFMALIGLSLGILGIVMGTLSRSSTKRGLSTLGLTVSSLAVLASLAVWTYAIKHDPRFGQSAATTNNNATAPAVAESAISTPCYSAGFINKLNISNAANSCDLKAFNGMTMTASTDAYRIYADNSQTIDTSNYAALFKSALEKDVHDNLPGFSTDSEMTTEFAGSPAYTINASDKAESIAIIEAAVWHKTSAGDNIFILVHAVNGNSADLNTLEAQWQWK